jgi:hypothetical protein
MVWTMSCSLATTRTNFIRPSQDSSLSTLEDFPVNLPRPTGNYIAKLKVKGGNLFSQNNHQFSFPNAHHEN